MLRSRKMIVIFYDAIFDRKIFLVILPKNWVSLKSYLINSIFCEFLNFNRDNYLIFEKPNNLEFLIELINLTILDRIYFTLESAYQE